LSAVLERIQLEYCSMRDRAGLMGPGGTRAHAIARYVSLPIPSS
jgi:hypothetical protein